MREPSQERTIIQCADTRDLRRPGAGRQLYAGDGALYPRWQAALPAAVSRWVYLKGAEVAGVEVHVKDARLPGRWGFFSFSGTEPAKLLPQAAACYSCHSVHGAVDTTFVQFYPTLLPIARSKGTVSAATR